MNKSILIIDTPACCYECELYIEDSFRNWCAGTSRCPNDDSIKPDWCPLQELPACVGKRKELGLYEDYFIREENNANN